MKTRRLPMLAVVALMLGLSTPALADEQLLGKWEMQIVFNGNPIGKVEYDFLQNGTLTITSRMNQLQPESIGCTYAVANGSLTITLPENLGGQSITSAYAIRGNELVITPQGDRESFTLTRVQE